MADNGEAMIPVCDHSDYKKVSGAAIQYFRVTPGFNAPYNLTQGYLPVQSHMCHANKVDTYCKDNTARIFEQQGCGPAEEAQRQKDKAEIHEAFMHPAKVDSVTLQNFLLEKAKVTSNTTKDNEEPAAEPTASSSTTKGAGAKKGRKSKAKKRRLSDDDVLLFN